MKNLLILIVLTFTLAFAVAGQEKMNHAKPTEKDKIEIIPTDGFLKRGAALSGNAKKVSLTKVLKNPSKYAGKTVHVEGVIVRSCKKEGCWLELAPGEKSKSVRVTMKDHGFFVPLSSAGAKARAEGVFSVRVLSKEQVRHLIEDDGAQFENINPDGTVTEISFEAAGIELTRTTK